MIRARRCDELLMPWLQFILETTPEQAAELSEGLEQAGALSVTLQDAADQPLYEPPLGTTPLWRATRVIGLFDAAQDPGEVAGLLAQRWAPRELPPWRATPLEDKDWNRAWMDQFHPIRFGRRLWIVPSWHTAPDPAAANILLDPGLAFGTGTHPTTQLCLQWLDAWEARERRVIDYGCGSGILALAAARLGAASVWAVDNDPQALLATRENARRNGLEGQIHAVLPQALPQAPADLLLANILASPLLDLAPRLASLVFPGGSIVLSGILCEQADTVSAAYARWFDMGAREQREGWVRLEGRKK